MIGILASQCAVLGKRLASGLNDTSAQTNANPVTVEGVLITDTSDFLVSNTGDYLEYSEPI